MQTLFEKTVKSSNGEQLADLLQRKQRVFNEFTRLGDGLDGLREEEIQADIRRIRGEMRLRGLDTEAVVS